MSDDLASTRELPEMPADSRADSRVTASKPAGQSKKRRGRLTLILAIVVLVLIALAVVLELVLRTAVPEQFERTVREQLSLSEDHPVEVALTGLLTPQLIAGRLTDVSIAVPNVPLAEGIRADLYGSADSAPLNFDAEPIEGAVIGARIAEEELGAAVQLLTRGIGQDVEIFGDHLTVSNVIPILGQSIPISIDFTLDASDGEVHIELVSVDAAGVVTVTPEQLGEVPGGVFDGILSGLNVCIADQIPAGITLTDIVLSSTQTLTVEATVDPEIGMNPVLQELGTC